MAKTLSERKNILGLLVAVFIVLLPFLSSGKIFYGSTNFKSLYIVGAVSLILLYFAYRLFKFDHISLWRRRWLLLSSGLLLLVYWLSALLGIFPEGSIYGSLLRGSGMLFLSLLLFVAFIVSEFFGEKDWQLCWKTIATSGAVFAFLSFFGIEGFGWRGKLLGIDFGTHGLSFGNSTFAGIYLLLTFLITLLVIARSPKGSGVKKLFILLAGIQLFSPTFFNSDMWLGKISLSGLLSNPALFIGDARASSITAFLALAYFIGYFLFRKIPSGKIKRGALFGWAALFLLSITFLIGSLFSAGSRVQNHYIEQSTIARILVWNGGLEALDERPVLGWGPENFHFAQRKYLDNRLYLKENFGEPWFDRAHNVFVDGFVALGIVGVVMWIVLISFFFRTLLRARRHDLINSFELHIFGALIVGHILQLQTGFNTVSSYALLAIILAYGLSLERKTLFLEGAQPRSLISHESFRKVVAVFIGLLAIFSLYQLSVSEYSRQRALVDIVQSSNQQEQLAAIERGLENAKDFESLRVTSAAFIKGWMEQLGSLPKGEFEQATKAASEQMQLYQHYYERYLEKAPEDYRARMNYAYLLITRITLGEDHFEAAREVIRSSYDLSSENPLTYVLDSLVSLYTGNLEEAEQLLDQALALNPDIEFTRTVVEYFEKQKKSFPEIALLKLVNL